MSNSEDSPTPEEDDDISDSDPMNPEAWYREPDICGSCIAWRPRDPEPEEDIATGVCRLRAELRRVPASLKKCDLYKPRGQFVYKPGREPKKKRKKAATLRVLRRSEDGELVADRTVALSRPIVNRERPPVPRTVEVGTDDQRLLKRAFQLALAEDFPDAGREIHARFEGGKVKIKGKDGKVTKEVSTERFFELLERFRVSMEQLEDKVVSTEPLLTQFAELRKQMLGIQGSLTTFNFLYSDRTDYFSGKG